MMTDFQHFTNMIKHLPHGQEKLENRIILISFKGQPRLKKKKGIVRQLITEFYFDKSTGALKYVEAWDYKQKISDANEMDRLMNLEPKKKKQ